MTRFPIISAQNLLILASASPRRKRLLAQVGIPFQSVTSKANEEGVSGDPAQISRVLAEKKAFHVCSETGHSWILGADTIVTIDNRILGKPEDSEKAREMLLLLGGKEHRVITGFCILDPSAMVAHSESVTTLVRFKPLSVKEIEAYVRTGEPFGKAGAYAIQGMGSFMVEAITGSYTNVVGLPLCAVIKALVSARALECFPLA
ncbi:MAG: septum formation protein Maf [Deltaproteobacteria bacterium]|nr:septum formation protein Maf [Deltaproteobacteria bacterium]MBW2118296.1 septum formation protein Maf [Deltaproteobacteria bacterium]MBW2342847.1 septum formation protein Maf [Deltaproteobacteria bacterium]HDH98360.1 septum formation protein Maf [Deltaproteobacteria bacterium]